MQGRNCFIGQVNNLVCFFDKLSWATKLSLFKVYCNNIFGCELWSFDTCSVEKFYVTWRTGLRWILSLPQATHNYFLPVLQNTLITVLSMYQTVFDTFINIKRQSCKSLSLYLLAQYVSVIKTGFYKTSWAI